MLSYTLMYFKLSVTLGILLVLVILEHCSLMETDLMNEYTVILESWLSLMPHSISPPPLPQPTHTHTPIVLFILSKTLIPFLSSPFSSKSLQTLYSVNWCYTNPFWQRQFRGSNLTFAIEAIYLSAP